MVTSGVFLMTLMLAFTHASPWNRTLSEASPEAFKVTFDCDGYERDQSCPELYDDDDDTCCSLPHRQSVTCDVSITPTNPMMGNRIDITSIPPADHLEVKLWDGRWLGLEPSETIGYKARFKKKSATEVQHLYLHTGRLCNIEISTEEDGTSPATNPTDATSHPPPDAWRDWIIGIGAVFCILGPFIIVYTFSCIGRQRLQKYREQKWSCLRGLFSRLCRACRVRNNDLQSNIPSAVTLSNGAAIQESTGAPEEHGDGDATEERNGRHDAGDTVELYPLMTTGHNTQTA